MKRVLSVLLALVFCLSVLSGCGSLPAKATCYVGHVAEDGFVADINDLEVFVKCNPTEYGIELFDTVTIQYTRSDLKEIGGSYTAISGHPARYSHTLEKFSHLHVNDPSKGEIVYG